METKKIATLHMLSHWITTITHRFRQSLIPHCEAIYPMPNIFHSMFCHEVEKREALGKSVDNPILFL